MRKFAGSNPCCSCDTLLCTNSCECRGIEGPSPSQGRNVLQDQILASNIILPTGIEIASRITDMITCPGEDPADFDDSVTYKMSNLSEFGYKNIPSVVMNRVDYSSTETFHTHYDGRCCYRGDVDLPVGSTLADGWFLGGDLDNSDGFYTANEFDLLAGSGWPTSVSDGLSSGYIYLTQLQRFMGVRGVEFSVRIINGSSAVGVLSILPKEIWIPKISTDFRDRTVEIQANPSPMFFSGLSACDPAPTSNNGSDPLWDGVSIEKIPYDDPRCVQGTYGPTMRLVIPKVEVPVWPDASGEVVGHFPWPHMGMSPSYFSQDVVDHMPFETDPCNDSCTSVSMTSQIKVGADVDLSLSKVCWDNDGNDNDGQAPTSNFGCWSNWYGGGCIPISKVGMPANAQPTENLTFTEPDGTVWTQSSGSYWTDNSIYVPVTSLGQSDPELQVYVVQEYDEEGAINSISTAGRKLQMMVLRPDYPDPNDPFGFPILGFQRDYIVDLDRCGGGTITGLDDTNPSLITTFEWPYGEDCEECETPEVNYGCCLLPDGTTQITNGASACEGTLSGTFQGVGTSCPPTGCCTLPDDSTEAGVTEAYCTAQGGTWEQGSDCSVPPEPTGCCELVGSPDQSGLTESECDALGGSWTEGATCGPTGWCIDNSDGSVTSGVEENDCTGTWSSTEPVMGCCEIGGVQNSNVAEDWCTDQGGTFNAGDCVSDPFDPTTSARITVNSLTLDAPDPSMNCTDNFEFTLSGTPTGSYTVNGTKETEISGSVNGDSTTTGQPSSLTPVISKVEAVFNSFPANTYNVNAFFYWTAPSGDSYYLKASTNTATTVGIGDCPSFTLSGSFDTVESLTTLGASTWSQSCNSISASDLVGSYNITVECQ